MAHDRSLVTENSSFRRAWVSPDSAVVFPYKPLMGKCDEVEPG